MHRKQIKIAVLAPLLLLLSIAGYLWLAGRQSPPTAPPPVPLEKITLGINAGKLSGLVFIAQDQGFFRNNGLDAHLIFYESGRDAVRDLLAGRLDFACCTEFVLVHEIFADHDNLRVLGSIAQAEINELIARKDRGINRPADLKGKRIGLPRETVSEYIAGRFLTFAGLSVKDVTLVNLMPSALEGALVDGQVDAVMAFDPWMIPIKDRLKDQVVSWPGQSGHQSFWFVVALAAEIQKKPVVMVKLLRALGQAQKFLAAYPREGDYIIAQGSRLPKAVNSSVLPTKYDLDLDQTMLLAMEDEARWLIRNQLTYHARVPNYLNYLYPEALLQVNPKALRLIIPGKGSHS